MKKKIRLRKQEKERRFKSKLTSSIVYLVLLAVPFIAFSQQYDFTKQEDVKEFDHEIELILQETGIHGVSLAVIEDAEVVYTNFYGYMNMSNMSMVTKHTLFEACSLSKMYFIFAAMQLVEQKVLDLDKPLYKILEKKELAHDERYKLITPRMLLNHTSGIENWIEFNDPSVLEIVANPGTEFVYSGAGYNYLADAITVILGESYEEYMRRLVLKPLKIEEKTSFFLNKERANVIYSKGHDFTGKETPTASDHISPASSMFTDAASYVKLLTALFDEKYLSKESIDYLLNQHMLFADYSDFKAYLTNGFFVFENGDERVLNFNGSNSGFKSQFAYSIENKRGYVYLTNSDYGDLFGRRLNNLTSNFKYYNIVYFSDSYSIELLSFFRSLFQLKGEKQLYNELIENYYNFDWTQKKESRNPLFIVSEGFLMAIAFLIFVISIIRLFVRNRLKKVLKHALDTCATLLRWSGLIYLLVSLIYMIKAVHFFDEIQKFSPLFLSFTFLILLTQTFWIKKVRNSFFLRIVVCIFLLPIVYMYTGIPLVFVEKTMINYEANNLLTQFSQPHLITILIVLLLAIIFFWLKYGLKKKQFKLAL
ncbi:serine hydrolase domain-containing protein [Ascidiimonas sp. W6]|uniref:serine hydrolase domain-containing protein n=1 Tax=Ascidiimonas meishanensis TaxID=3128903 RepID=UPI0030EEDDD9